MASEFKTLANGAVQHQKFWRSTSDLDVLVKGTDDVTADTAAITTAVAALNDPGGNGGTLWLEGTLRLNAVQKFTKPVSIRGVDHRTHLNIETTTSLTGFVWNDQYNPRTATTFVMDPASAGDTWVNSATSGAARGDVICIFSNDDVPNADPHAGAGGHYYSMEIHKVNDVSAGQGIYFDDFLSDPYQTTPQLTIVPTFKNIVVADLSVEYTGPTPSETLDEQWSFLQMLACENVIVENVRFATNGPGAINVNHCVNVRLQGLMIGGQAARPDWYGVTIGNVNGCRFSDSLVSGTRHAFTTGNGSAANAGNDRWGGPRNCIVENVTAKASTDLNYASTNSHVVMDTHTEGYQTQFRDCVVTAVSGGGYQNYAFQSRARETRFVNCVAQAPDGVYAPQIAFLLKGHKNEMIDCTVKSGATGAVIEANQATAYGGCKITNCSFDGTLKAVTHLGGDDTEIRDNRFARCGDGTNPVIALAGGTGQVVHGNHVDRYNNLNSIDTGTLTVGDVTIADNIFLGYGQNTCGFSGTSGSLLDSTWQLQNRTDL